MIKRVIAICLLGISIQPVYAQILSQQIRQDIDGGLLSEMQGLYFEALQVVASEALPDRYRRLTDQPVKSAMNLCFRVKTHWDRFTPDQQERLRRLVFRPNLPYSFVSPSTRFRIHYALTGTHAVSMDDYDSSGISDYVEEAANAFDYVYTVQVDQLGFEPPLDDSNGDGPEWDVYIQNIGAYGWTYPETRISTDPDVYSAYMVIDNDYTHTYTEGINGLRVTAAHEFFHMIQLGYNGRDENNDGSFDDSFLMEAGSTFMEDVVYDSVNDYYNYLGLLYSTQTGYFDRTNVSFDHTDGWREYGLAVWFHFLEKRTGSRDIVRSLWEEIVDYPGLDALDRALLETGRTLNEELVLFYAWNYITGSRADDDLYYPEGSDYPEIRLDGEYIFSQDTTFTADIRSLAARYYQFQHTSGDVFTLIPVNLHRTVDGQSGDFNLVLVQGIPHPAYTDLSGDVQTRMLSDSPYQWRASGVVESSGLPAQVIPFDATQDGLTAEDLPANFPNPFIPESHSMTAIPFVLEEAGNVKITIMNASGYAVKAWERSYSEGLQYGYWNGRDDQNRPVPSGIYFYVVSQNSRIVRRDKIMVIR